MKKEIPLSVPNLNSNIMVNLQECIETGWVSTGGRFISEFENMVAQYVKVEDAVSVQSGTAGLHVALRILGVEAGDEVIVPTLTFIAAVNPVSYMGANPIFMDCNDSLCLDHIKLERFCQNECYVKDGNLINRLTGKRVAAIIVVHVFGNIADMENIMRIANTYNLKVLEDATEALGSYYTEGPLKGKYSGTIGDIGVYSFNANKIITTGGGGMIVSANQKYLEQARYLSITAKNDSLYFIHDEVGYNYRMLNIQAALGVSQIDELEAFIERKIRNYNLYSELLRPVLGIDILPFQRGQRDNHWFYSLVISEKKYGMNRNLLMNNLLDMGIQCRPVWKLIHKQKPYLNSLNYEIDKAHHYEANVLNVPCSTNLTEEEVKYICNKIIGLKS